MVMGGLHQFLEQYEKKTTFALATEIIVDDLLLIWLRLGV